MIKRLHPLTKLLLLVGLVAIPYLWWTGTSEVEGVAQATRGAALGEPTDDAGQADAVRRTLPPLQSFAAVVERPLFTPTRRLVRPVEVMPEEPPEQEPTVEEPEPEPALGEPELRFFGTVRQRGRTTALVTREGEASMEQLAIGDLVEDAWEVVRIGRDELVLAYDGREARYRIFVTGAAE